jgi:type VI secretion system protein ImpF
MARPDSDVNITPTVLDRLLDDRPMVTREPVPDRFQTLSQLRRSVTRDLDALLNSRQEALDELPSDFEEVGRSLLIYGLPDFTALGPRSANDRNRVRRALETAIATFEPRLERVRVTLQPGREHEQTLRFHIDAMLRVEPAPEPITFDAVLQLNTQQYTVHRRE